MPKISIITINYNDKEGLEKTIQSVISQTYKDYEFIIIDGGSTDGSKEAIKKYREHIHNVVSEPDSGIYHAMNKGILRSSGQYINFMNAGDHFYENDSLEKFVKEMTNENIMIYYGDCYIATNNKIRILPEKLTLKLFINDSLAHSATMIQTKAFDKIGLYDESLKIVADYKFFVEAICSHNLSTKKINTVLSTYYLDGISSSKEHLELHRTERNTVMNEHFGFYLDEYRDYLIIKHYQQNGKIFKFLNSLGNIKKKFLK